MRTTKRKSQMEIMGLVIIVALLMIGMLFIIRFSFTADKQTLKKSYSDKEMISNFLNSMRFVTVEDCNSATVEQLLVDCYDGERDISCNIDVIDSCKSDNPLDPTLQTFVKNNLLNGTLDQWGVVYSIRISQDAAGTIPILELYNPPKYIRPGGLEINDKACIEENENSGLYSKIEPYNAPMPLGSGTNMYAKIMLCS